jgi:hypothetical protein
MEPTISRTVAVAADPHLVWSLVTDLTAMGEYSPENVGGHWLPPATGPGPGAEFRGTNRNGRRLWHTRATVVEWEDGVGFTFDVHSSIGLRVSRWGYQVRPDGDGCLLTEHWYRVGNRFVQRFLGPRVTGRTDRPGFNVHSIEHTLARVKARAESAARGGPAGRTPSRS